MHHVASFSGFVQTGPACLGRSVSATGDGSTVVNPTNSVLSKGHSESSQAIWGCGKKLCHWQSCFKWISMSSFVSAHKSPLRNHFWGVGGCGGGGGNVRRFAWPCLRLIRRTDFTACTANPSIKAFFFEEVFFFEMSLIQTVPWLEFDKILLVLRQFWLNSPLNGWSCSLITSASPASPAVFSVKNVSWTRDV